MRAESGSEMNRALPFVAIVCLSAIAAALFVPLPPSDAMGRQVVAALMLVALGVGAEMLSYDHSRKNTSGSISLIPFAAAGLCAPSVASVIAIALGSALVQALSKRHWVKGLFNVAQMVFGLSLSVLVFRAAGGVSFLVFKELSVIEVARVQLLSAGLLVAALILVNTATVSGVVAIVQQRSVIDIWKATTLPTAPFIALTAFLAFYLA